MKLLFLIFSFYPMLLNATCMDNPSLPIVKQALQDGGLYCLTPMSVDKIRVKVSKFQNNKADLVVDLYYSTEDSTKKYPAACSLKNVAVNCDMQSGNFLSVDLTKFIFGHVEDKFEQDYNKFSTIKVSWNKHERPITCVIRHVLK